MTQSVPVGPRFEEANAHEVRIARAARRLRGRKTELTAELYAKLHPLLCAPIPPAFVTVERANESKPYDSIGVSTPAILWLRMDNVLSPMWWWDEPCWFGQGDSAGHVAQVTVFVGSDRERPLTWRTARGGVENRNPGDRCKGSETSAFKLAVAKLGPGRELRLQSPEHFAPPAPVRRDEDATPEARAALRTSLTALLQDERAIGRALARLDEQAGGRLPQVGADAALAVMDAVREHAPDRPPRPRAATPEFLAGATA